jgi:hypothetical protein
MKTKIKTFKLTIALCLMFLLPMGVMAAPIAYVCGSGSVALKYDGTSPYTLVNGDLVIWQQVDDNGTPIGGAISKTYNGTASSTDLVLTGGTELTTAGEYFYRVHVVASTAGSCTGDPADAISVYRLPAFTVALSSTVASYCAGGSTNSTPAVVTATATPASGTFPAGVSVTYDWAGSTGGAVDGTDNAKYNFGATNTAATYNVSAKGTFAVPSGTLLKSDATAGCTATGTTSVIVTPVPGKPTITAS